MTRFTFQNDKDRLLIKVDVEDSAIRIEIDANIDVQYDLLQMITKNEKYKLKAKIEHGYSRVIVVKADIIGEGGLTELLKWAGKIVE